MRRLPTERQAALAARQLHYHRERLGWIRDRIQDNEALLLLYVTRLGTCTTVLPGGYRVTVKPAAPPEDVAIEKLTPESRHEQLELRLRGRTFA